MFLDNQLAAQRDHEQDADPSTEQGQHKNPEVFEIESQKDQRREREDHAGRNRLARVPCRLNDVVLKNRSPPSARSTLMDRTAIGIDAATVSPARSPT